jgi:hypothetical protein
MPTATQMVQPTIAELSGVDHPAHLTEGWLVLKDASPATAKLLRDAELIAKGIDPSTVRDPQGSDKTMPLTDEQRAALAPEAAAYIKSLENAATATSVTKSAAAASDHDQEAFEKAIAGLPEASREMFRKQQRETADAKAMAKGLYDAAQDTHFENMAKSLVHLPGVDTEGANNFAKSLRKSAESNPAAFEDVFRVLKAADSAIEQSGFYKEIGTGAAGAGSGSDALMAIAKSKFEKAKGTDKEITLAEAVTEAAVENPDLYATHTKEN